MRTQFGSNSHMNSFTWRQITPTEVLKCSSKLSNTKSMDFYYISNYILRQTVEYICEPLSFIFSKCLEVGYFPDALKISKILPVFKKGDKSLPQNYRPISMFPFSPSFLNR